jgi:hypothetical protein
MDIEHVAHMGRREMLIGFWWGSQNERNHQEYLDVGERIISKLILRDIGWGGMDTR